MIHLDLFSGIGGFAYAVDSVWPDSEHIFCEIDPFCQAVLRKHWKGSEIYGDIRGLTADTDSDRQSRGGTEIVTAEAEQQTLSNAQGRTNPPGVFLLTGGFPCQPFSQAGKRKGTNDNRYLWPEMLRVIREFHPSWVIAENVRGLLTIEQGVVFEQVCLDLEGEGYEVQPFVIPAVAVNAPHRRDRVWFCAHAIGDEHRGGEGQIRETEGISTEHRSTICSGRIGRASSNAPDTDNGGLEGTSSQREATTDVVRKDREPYWNQNWLEVATELCGVDDGLPADMDGVTISKARHRVERLKALGNAIVPQVAVELLRAIRMAEQRIKDTPMPTISELMESL